jgi:hypothetical protein
MELPKKQIKHTKIEKFGSTLFDLLNKRMLNILGHKGVLDMLLVKVIKKPFYHSCPLGKLC